MTTPAATTLSARAAAYLDSGLSVLPAVPRTKRPDLATWRTYQRQLPGRDEVERWFVGAAGACIVCGAVSGNLEMIDFDLEGKYFGPWRESVEAEAPGLVDRLVIEETPSGGRHVVYRCESAVCGNVKLAHVVMEAPDEMPLVVGTKEYKPRPGPNGSWAAQVVSIETRGEGGLFLCDPTPGYRVVQGDLARPPVLTADERAILLGAAWRLDQLSPPTVIDGPPTPATPSITAPATGPVSSVSASIRPGDEFNARGDVREILRRHGWTLVKTGDNEHWRRPGKDTGSSATLKDGVFYVFSSNAAPFEPHKGYSPFAVYAMLEHRGDFNAAAVALAGTGYGRPAEIKGVDLSAFFAEAPAVPEDGPAFISVGQLVDAYPTLRRPIIHGLLREGETMNVIAPPKAHKSWMILDLAMSIATGRPWLDRFPTEAGQVLILDNELHRETSAYRFPRVAEAAGVAMREIRERIFIDNLRGHLKDYINLAPYFRSIEPGRFKAIVLDAHYRFMPAGSDENDNAAMANIYNAIDRYADLLGCCFILIHHASKGNQSGKSVTDIGAGAGSQSRAVDAHLVLRPHEQPGVVVLDAAVRSFSPIKPVCLRWDWPLWQVAEDLDPTALEGLKKPKGRQADAEADEPAWTAVRFVDQFIDDEEPRGTKALEAIAKDEPGLSRNKVRSLISEASNAGLIQLVKMDPDGRGRPQQGYIKAPGSDLWNR